MTDPAKIDFVNEALRVLAEVYEAEVDLLEHSETYLVTVLYLLRALVAAHPEGDTRAHAVAKCIHMLGDLRDLADSGLVDAWIAKLEEIAEFEDYPYTDTEH